MQSALDVPHMYLQIWSQNSDNAGLFLVVVDRLVVDVFVVLDDELAVLAVVVGGISQSLQPELLQHLHSQLLSTNEPPQKTFDKLKEHLDSGDV